MAHVSDGALNSGDKSGAKLDEEAVSLDFSSVEYGVRDIQVKPRNSILPGRKRYLCFFLHRHLSFRLPEVQAVAEMLYGMSNMNIIFECTWDT